MKIGVFHPALHMSGGAELVALVVANALARSDYETELYVSQKINQEHVKRMLGEELASSVEVIVKPSSVQRGGSFDFFPITFDSYIFKRKCDILVDTYSNCILPWADVCYIHFPFLNRYDYQTNFPYLKSRHIRHLISLPYAIYAKKLQNYDNKLIIANSIFTAEAIKEFLNVDVKVLYPPVQSSLFNKPEDNLSEDSKENLVVTVSRFAPDKGLERIPYIAKLTRDNAKFVLIGLLHDPNFYQSIVTNIARLNLSNKVKPLPDAPKTELENTLKKAKVYLHTTEREHFGISIVEAMAKGCIPIVPNSGGMREFVPVEYRYENLQDAAQKIENALHEWTPNEARKMVKIAEQFSESNFSRDFIQLFSSYLEKRGQNEKG